MYTHNNMYITQCSGELTGVKHLTCSNVQISESHCCLLDFLTRHVQTKCFILSERGWREGGSGREEEREEEREREREEEGGERQGEPPSKHANISMCAPQRMHRRTDDSQRTLRTLYILYICTCKHVHFRSLCPRASFYYKRTTPVQRSLRGTGI